MAGISNDLHAETAGDTEENFNDLEEADVTVSSSVGDTYDSSLTKWFHNGFPGFDADNVETCCLTVKILAEDRRFYHSDTAENRPDTSCQESNCS